MRRREIVCYNNAVEQGNETGKKQKRTRAFGAALLGAAAAVMGWQLFAIYESGVRYMAGGLIALALVTLPLAAGAFLFARSYAGAKTRRRAMRAVLAVVFAWYCAALVGVLFFSRIDFLHREEAAAFYRENMELMTNFKPLETVRLYLRAIRYNYIGMDIPLANLVGNMLLFMPMAVFLPCLFRAMGRLWVFLVAMLLLLIATEALQFLLACGSCDVDDVLLNLAGTLAVYGILKIPPVRRLLRRLYLLPDFAAEVSGDPAE